MSRLLKWLEKPIDWLFWLGLAATTLMMLHVTADVTSRYILNKPFEGTTEIVAAYYMVVVAYCPWAWIAVRDNHIVAGMFQNIGGPRFDFWLDIFVKAFTLLFLAVFAYQTFLAALRQTRVGEVWLAGTMYIPVWPSRWVLPISAGLMGIYLIVRIIVDVARGGPPPRRTDAAGGGG
jgi:TRAP-type C4-dicarboxylate transport system permease small subunit